MYRVVHTGPKTQFGGLNEGLFRDAYHSGTACAVKIPAIDPTARGNSNDKVNLIIFDLVIMTAIPCLQKF
jgi:hypothetical protein